MKNRSGRSLAAIFAAAAFGLSLFLLVPASHAASTAVVKTLDGSHTLCKKLVAGQNIEVGTVCFEVVGSDLQVTYSVTATGWSISQIHFWTGTHVDDMPQNKAGNPVIGKFPYKSPLFTAPLPTIYVLNVPLLNLSFACPTDKDVNYYAAAHASLVGPAPYGAQTAWGDGDRINTQGNWGMYYTYTLSCSNNEAERLCETAFAVESLWYYANPPSGDSTCFLDLKVQTDGSLAFVARTGANPNGDFKRWGWSNGPLQEGIHTFEIWAAAGRCILANGIHVGTLTLDYSGGMATVTYDLFDTPDGWGIDQLHLYVGTEPLARDVNDEFTVAPGQYTIIKDHVEDFLNDTVTLGPFSGDIYLVGHATVCREL